MLLKKDADVGLTLGNQPSEMQLPIFVWSLSLLVSASLFALGGLTALRGPVQVAPSVALDAARGRWLAMSIGVGHPVPRLAELLPPFIGRDGLGRC